ncbi:MAG: anthranilate synthase component I [Gammaproteobacteria bacterium]|nr:anthranilate synthase component I [Gammaproteobacteria bacterium]|tara:strand:- start:2375 stop:3802 length:1428 start_codon:yes stop_codon:yes gene_type:complete
MGFFLVIGFFEMNKYFDIELNSETPATVFMKLRQLTPTFLLESIERGVDQSRYSFLGIGSSQSIQVRSGTFFLNGDEISTPNSQEEMMNLFRKTLSKLPDLKPAIDTVPFSGGIVGFSSFDMVRYFEHLPIAKNKKGILAPPDSSYISPTSLLIFDHKRNKMALVHSGNEDERVQLRTEILAMLNIDIEPNLEKTIYSEPEANIDKKTFYEAVDKAKHHIYEGDIFQIVLSIAFSGSYDLDPFDVYRAMRLINPSPYMFYCESDGFKIAGSSPEALVRLNSDKASLRPIAGTRPRGSNTEEDKSHKESLLADEKEIAEHIMLVDLARNDLGRVAKHGSIEVSPYQSIEYYSHVMHIVSGVQGKLDEKYDAFDLFAAAFPAGTLVGAPKVRAMELIDHIEPNLRGVYGGTVGYFAKNGDMDQAIAIRTIVFSDEKYCFQAGAGIVADSMPENEYKEVLAKSEILRTALKMVKEGEL